MNGKVSEVGSEETEVMSFDQEPETHEEDDGAPPFPLEAAEDD